MRGTHQGRHGQQSRVSASIHFKIESLGELNRIESVLRGRNYFISVVRPRTAHRRSYSDAIRTTCLWRSSVTAKANRLGRIITEGLPFWFYDLRWTSDTSTLSPQTSRARPSQAVGARSALTWFGRHEVLMFSSGGDVGTCNEGQSWTRWTTTGRYPARSSDQHSVKVSRSA